MQLTSAKNSQLQSIRKAARSGRPTDEGLIVIEGPHLLEEVLRSGWAVDRVLGTPKAFEAHAGLLAQVEAELVEVAASAFSSISATDTSQEILALVRPKTWSLAEALWRQSLVVVLDGIQDPGNVGTIVRSAEAFGAGGIVLLTGCARVSNGKLLRAAAGSLFRLPYAEGIAREELREQAAGAGLYVYALTGRAGKRIEEADFTKACALIVGGEGAGISEALLRCAEAVSISTRKVESLNAAVACSIALFEAQRQRSAG